MHICGCSMSISSENFKFHWNWFLRQICEIKWLLWPIYISYIIDIPQLYSINLIRKLFISQWHQSVPECRSCHEKLIFMWFMSCLLLFINGYPVKKSSQKYFKSINLLSCLSSASSHSSFMVKHTTLIWSSWKHI